MDHRMTRFSGDRHRLAQWIPIPSWRTVWAAIRGSGGFIRHRGTIAADAGGSFATGARRVAVPSGVRRRRGCATAARAIDIQAVAAKEATRFDHAVALFPARDGVGGAVVHLAGHGAGHVLAAPPLARRRAEVLVGEHAARWCAATSCSSGTLLERRAPGRGDPYPCRTVGGGSPVPGVALPPVLSPRWHQCRNRGQRAGRERHRQSGVRGGPPLLRSRAASDLVCYIEPLLRAAEKDMAALDLVLLPHCARCTEFATTVYWRAHTHPRASEAVLAVVPAAHRAALLRSRRFACALVSDIVHQRQRAEFVPCRATGRLRRDGRRRAHQHGDHRAERVLPRGHSAERAATPDGGAHDPRSPVQARGVPEGPVRARRGPVPADHLLLRRHGLGLRRHPHGAGLCSDHDGPGAVTLYSVHASRMDVCSYVMECNLSESLQSIRQRFIAAAAFSCCLCLFLGIGDRHLENIMVTERGELFHIDFEYILGEQPSGNLLTPGWANRASRRTWCA